MSDQGDVSISNSHQQEDSENTRAEYAAISNYFNTIVTFRFTTLGLFIAAVGFILGGEITREKALIVLVIDVALYVIELRNRTLYDNLSARAMQIERTYWGYMGKRAYEPFYSRMMKSRPKDDEEAGDPPPLDYPRWHNGRVVLEIAVSHSGGLDLLYGAIAILALVKLLSG